MANVCTVPLTPFSDVVVDDGKPVLTRVLPAADGVASHAYLTQGPVAA